MINLSLNDDQRQIVDGIAAFLAVEAPTSRLRGAVPHDDSDLWPKLGGLGVFGLGLPEEAGGAGYGLAEQVLVFRELGRALASPAVLSTTVAAHLALAASDTALARQLSAGAARVGLGIADDPAASATEAGAAFHILEGKGADLVLVFDDAGAGLARLDQLTDMAPFPCLDWTLDGVRGRLQPGPGLIWNGGFDLPVRAGLLACAMLCGSAQAVLDITLDYVKTREQFGQPLGAFQSVKHRCADMAKRASAAWSQTCFAALLHASHAAEAGFQARAAKILATDAAIENAEAAIQSHGAMGFTADSLVHLYLKRAHVLDLVGGDANWQRERFMDEPSPVYAI